MSPLLKGHSIVTKLTMSLTLACSLKNVPPSFVLLLLPPSFINLTADNFATFFINKITNLTAQFSTPQSVKHILPANINSFIYFSPLSETEVSKLIPSSHPFQSSYYLSAWSYSISSPSKPFLLQLFLHSLTSSTHPFTLEFFPQHLGKWLLVSEVDIPPELPCSQLLKTCKNGFQVSITYLAGSVCCFWYGQPPDPPVNLIEKGHLRNHTPVVWVLPLRPLSPSKYLGEVRYPSCNI